MDKLILIVLGITIGYTQRDAIESLLEGSQDADVPVTLDGGQNG